MDYQPGDLVFCHSKGFMSRAIRLAERIRFRGGDAYNHVAVLDRYSNENGWTVIQAEARGVTNIRLLTEIAVGGSYVVVPCPADRDAVVHFAEGEVGRKYGFLTIASILITLLLPNFIDVMLPDTWICSAVAGEALRAGGWYHRWPDIYQVSPAALWEAVK
jgi:hypothetical protein